MKKYIALIILLLILLNLHNVNAADCSDGTQEGLCSTTKPMKCISGTLTPSCSDCGCPSSLYVCLGSTCQISGVAIGICPDNTQNATCSTNNPGFFCDRGLLIPRCTNGCCPSTDYGFSYSTIACDGYNICYKRCLDNTLVNQCSTSYKGLKCVNGDFVASCSDCGCPVGFECTGLGTFQVCRPLAANLLIPNSCLLNTTSSDVVTNFTTPSVCAGNGWLCSNSTITKDPTCSGSNCPLFGTFKPGCTNGCCPAGMTCDVNNLCKPIGDCSDGTRNGQNSTNNIGWYCDNGRLKPAATSTGCPAGYYLDQFTNTCWPTGVEGGCAGVPDGQCATSQYQGFRCINSSLTPDCTNCGSCPTGLSCNNLDKKCYATTAACSDNTPAGRCSTVNLGAFCDGAHNPPNLVYSCSNKCPCPNNANYTCALDGKCKLNVCLSDGTPLNQCSSLNPGFFCNGNANLVPSCNSCICPTGFSCSADNTCKRNFCLDTTPLNSCSSHNEGYFCNSVGNLVLNCNSCSCQGVNSCSGTLVGTVQQLGTSQFTPLYVAAFTIVFLSLAVLFMFGYSTQNPHYIAKAKIEIFQMIVTIGMASIIVIASLTLCTFIAQFGFSSPIISATSYMQSLVLQADSQVRNLITSSLQNQLKATEWEFTPTIWTAIIDKPGGRGEGKFAHLKAISQSQEIMIDLLLPLMASLKVQLTALSMINQFAIELLVPFGILLRIIPFTRQAGDFLIALAIALYIVFPMSYVLNSYIYDNFIQSSSGLNINSDPNIDFAGIGALLPQAIFFPNLSIVITISFVMSFHKLLSQISSIMEGAITGFVEGGV